MNRNLWLGASVFLMTYSLLLPRSAEIARRLGLETESE